jgi:hypothetical protein
LAKEGDNGAHQAGDDLTELKKVAQDLSSARK